MSDFPRASTESQLKEWRTGQPGAERLSATILMLDGYEDIDPQAPLGGGDDRKDILCCKKNTTYVAGAYFALSDKSFSEVKNKFNHDLEGAERHNRRGFIFITNQHIGLSGRITLEGLAADQGKLCVLYHRERIRMLLDSPAGYGVRLEYLKIPMNESEQLAYFSNSNDKLENVLEQQTREIRNLSRRIDTLRMGQDYANHTMEIVATSLGKNVSRPPVSKGMVPASQFQAESMSSTMSAFINTAYVLSVHRLICNDFPFNVRGRIRTTVTWIAGKDASLESAKHVAPNPEEVASLLDELTGEWNDEYEELVSQNENEKIKALAKFHHKLLLIHPFVDGNGRVARAILIQQCIDLIGHVDPSLLDRGVDYYSALEQADKGSYESLRTIISRAVTE